MRAKGELIEALDRTGVAVLNADDARVRAMATRTSARILTYGAAPDADVHVDAVRLDHRARPRFTVRTPWGTTDVELAVSGAHMALNAAAAIAAAGTLGVTPDNAGAALAERDRVGGAHAGPDRAGRSGGRERRLQRQPDLGGGRPRRARRNARPPALLGLMAEIDDPPASHRLVAAHAARLGIEVMAVAVDLYGVTPVENPIRALGPLGPGDAVLVKGSLVAGLQPVAAQLAAGAEA